MVVQQRPLGLEKRAVGEDRVQLRQSLIGIIRRLVQLLAAVHMKDEGHDMPGEHIDYLFQLFESQ